MDIYRPPEWLLTELQRLWIGPNLDELITIDNGLAALQREYMIESRGDTPPYPKQVQEIQKFRDELAPLLKEMKDALHRD